MKIPKFFKLKDIIDVFKEKEEDYIEEMNSDELIADLMIGHEIEGYIEGKHAAILNIKEDYVTFCIGDEKIEIPNEEFGPDTVIYKNKTIKELLDEEIFYNIDVF